MKKLIRITSVPLSMEKLLGKQLTFMNNFYEVSAVSSDAAYLKTVAENLGVKYHAVEMTRAITPLKDLRSIYHMYRFFKKEKPDIVHSHTPKAGLVAMSAAALAGVKVRLHTVAGLPLLESAGAKRKVLNLVEKSIYAFCTKVYPNSEELKKIILKNKFCRAEKLKVIAEGSSNGIDLSHFDRKNVSDEVSNDLRKHLNISDKDFVFIFLGRIVKDKGINELVSAFKSLVDPPPAGEETFKENLNYSSTEALSLALRKKVDARMMAAPARFSISTSVTGLGLRKRLGKALHKNVPQNPFVYKYKIREQVYTRIHGFTSTLTEILPTITSPYPNVKLLLVGPLEQELNPVLGLTLAEIENNPQIIAVDYVQDVRPYLAISNCLMLPSYREGFPNVVLQAGAMGLPCIVTDINGCNEIVNHGDNGIIVPVKNEKALTAAMKTLLKENNTWRNQSDSLRQKIVDKYGQERIWEALLEEYREAVGE